MDSKKSLPASSLQPMFSVLHIVESPRTAFWFFRSLHKQTENQCALTSISSLEQAHERLNVERYDAIFIHIHPENPPHQADIALLKAWAHSSAIVAIVHTEADSPIAQHDINTLLEMGIDDYIPAQEVNTPLLPRLVAYAIERKQASIRLATMSQKDAVTGLTNRAEFMRLLSKELKASIDSDNITAVLLIDLDQFKDLNDSQGHSTGDQLLKHIAERLQHAMRQSDTIARLGGDEFVVMLKRMPNQEAVERVAKHLVKELAHVVELGKCHVFTTASIGIGIDQGRSTSESLLRHAEIAMYSAKQHGGNRYAFFTRKLQVAASLKVSLEEELNRAIAQNEFYLAYQPQLDLVTRKIYGAEVLLRWQHREHGQLPPNTFIPTLESTGLIVPVTRWVITQAIEQWASWIRQGTLPAGAHLSVNLSPKVLGHPSFVSLLHEIQQIPETKLCSLHFEITENLFIDGDDHIENLKAIHNAGFKLSMDDFGTGYSSLGYIKRFDLDCIKLDCEFTKDIVNSPVDLAITKAVINLGKDLGIDLIAEGVEDQATLDLLDTLGCRVIQGYFIARPLDSDHFKGFCLAS